MAVRPDAPVEIAPDPDGLGERFMAAFNDMEHRIRETGGPKESLASLARQFFGRRGLTFHLDAFSDFVDLRNTLAHGRHFRGGLLATPAPEVVAEAEKLRDLLLSPPRALDVMEGGPVVTCDVDDDLATVLPAVSEYGYTNIPVHNRDGQHVGLLTPQALARWLAATWDDPKPVGKVKVSDVLAFAQKKERPRFMGQDATVAQVVDALVGDELTWRAPAVLITDDGSRSGALLAIATSGDLPRLVSALELT